MGLPQKEGRVSPVQAAKVGERGKMGKKNRGGGIYTIHKLVLRSEKWGNEVAHGHPKGDGFSQRASNNKKR